MGKLSEKDFIQEGYQKDPFPFWLWFGVIVTLMAFVGLGGSWFNQSIGTLLSDNRFMQVTNREFSLFLWENPQHMRVNAKLKTGYLTGFEYKERVGLSGEAADDFVVAPPETIFLYHVWNRLIGDQLFSRPIMKEEFVEFLASAEEWRPRYWKQAPEKYVSLVERLPKMEDKDLQSLLPREVQKAFIGWKNYFKEGTQIAALRPTREDITLFVAEHPHYARHYWRNIRLSYLQDPLTAEQLAPFLQVAMFNAEAAYDSEN